MTGAMLVPLEDCERDPLGNPIVTGWCPGPCKMEPGPQHRHSLILYEDRARYVVECGWR